MVCFCQPLNERERLLDYANIYFSKILYNLQVNQVQGEAVTPFCTHTHTHNNSVYFSFKYYSGLLWGIITHCTLLNATSIKNTNILIMTVRLGQPGPKIALIKQIIVILLVTMKNSQFL